MGSGPDDATATDSSTNPTATGILEDGFIRGSSVEEVAATGIRGFVYSLFLFFISIVTGFISIVENYLSAAAGGVGSIMANYLGGIATIIEEGALSTANNFLLPGPFGFVEGLFWAFVGMFVLVQIFELFGTDIIGLPGADFIPFFGEEADDE